LADAAAVGDLIGRLAAEFGPVNCLINNASLFEHDTIDTMTRDSWAAHMDVNLYAPALLMQAFAAQLPEPMRGNVINIIDQRVWRLTPRFFSYTLSKAGLWTMTQTAAQALAPRIRVNAIAPGPTLRNARQSAEDFAAQEKNVLLQQGAALEEFGAAVRFILAAQSMTGQMIALDGGQHLAWETPDVHGLDE
ncbi:MAG TPA: short chain dehydrogenase, partial [Alphaproteobacteria bacterium]|nr:short chain dehydrogenase [Alphaproteobacteria bacterium]